MGDHEPSTACSEMVEHPFWKWVDRRGDGECWPWLGHVTLNNRGVPYGRYRLNGRMTGAHRAAWAIVNGEIPHGLVVRHHCDNSVCLNPAHLELGTQRDNVADRYERGRARHALGSAHGNAKLNEDMVRAIRRDLKAGALNQREIAERYGISQFGVRHARDGWKHVYD